MLNIASLLKFETLRLARKEVRSELVGLEKVSTHRRSETAPLNHHIEQSEKQGAPGSRWVPDMPGTSGVLGLTRSESGAETLRRAGASAHRGDLSDLESLRTGALQADAVIHTAFNHDFTHYLQNCEEDRRVTSSISPHSGIDGRKA